MQAQPTILFLQNANGLFITIETERLSIRSVQSDDAANYYLLFCNALHVEKFGNGLVRTEKEVDELINDVWVDRWKKNNPFSGYAVFEKSSKDFVGHIHFSPGHSKEAGQTEIGYIFLHAHWKKGYGQEVAKAIVHNLAPELVRRGYTIASEKLQAITATVRADNEASIKILTSIGMEQIGQVNLYDAERKLFSIKITI